MPNAEIRETTVTPDAGGLLVQLAISDAELHAEDAEILIQLSVRLPAYETPLLAQIQREAMETAQQELSGLLQDLAQEIQKMTQVTASLHPKKKP